MVSGSLTWIPLSTANASNIGFWTLHVVSMQIEGHAPVTLGYDGIIDSGTTLMYVSSSTFSSLKSQLSNVSGCSYSSTYQQVLCNVCPSLSLFKNIYVNFTGVQVEMQPSQYVDQYSDGSCDIGISYMSGNWGLFGD